MLSAISRELLVQIPEADRYFPNKKAAPIEAGAAERSTVPSCSRFPTLVLPRSGSEGRPFGRTLSRVAPLASAKNGIAGLLRCQRGIRPSRMLKKSASFVLASLRGSTYRSVRLATSLAAALLNGLFEHSARCPVVPDVPNSEVLIFSQTFAQPAKTSHSACFIDCRETIT